MSTTLTIAAVCLVVLVCAFLGLILHQLVHVSRMWKPLDLPVKRIDLHDPLVAPSARDALFAYGREFAALGFIPVGTLLLRETERGTQHVSLWSSEDYRIRCGIVSNSYRIAGSDSTRITVSFTTLFQDGTSLAVSDDPDHFPAPRSPIHQGMRLPRIKTPQLLLRTHKHLISLHPSKPKPEVVTDTTLEQWWSRTERESCEQDRLAGAIEVSTKNGRYYRSTWRAVGRLLVLTLPPAGSLRRLTNARRAQKLLLELGTSPSEIEAAARWKPTLTDASRVATP